MKKSAFSLVEVVVSLFLTMLIFVPTLEISNKQLSVFKNINSTRYEQDFFYSLVANLKNTDNFYLESKKIKFQTYKEIKQSKIFKNLNLEYPKNKDFNLDIDIKVQEIDFYSVKKEVNIIEISFSTKNKKFKEKIIKFKG